MKRSANPSLKVTDEETKRQFSIVLPKRALRLFVDEASAVEKKQENITDAFSELFQHDYTFLPLKPDHSLKPLVLYFNTKYLLIFY